MNRAKEKWILMVLAGLFSLLPVTIRAQTQVEHAVTDSVKDNSAAFALNPYYLQICNIIISNDRDDFNKDLINLSNSSDSNITMKVYTLCAKLYAVEKMGDETQLSDILTDLCMLKLVDQKLVAKRIQSVKGAYARLIADDSGIKRIQNAAECVFNKIESRPDSLYLYLLNIRLTTIQQYPEKVKFLGKAIQECDNTLVKMDGNSTITDDLKIGMQELLFLSIDNHYSTLKSELLAEEVFSYLQKYGVDGKHSADAYYRLVKSLNVLHKLGQDGESEATYKKWGTFLFEWRKKFESLPKNSSVTKIGIEWNILEKQPRVVVGQK